MVRLRAGLAVGVVFLVGGAPAPARDRAARLPDYDAAVVVQSGSTQAVAVLARRANEWRVVSRIAVARGIRAIAWRPAGRQLAVTTSGGNLSNELLVVDVARRASRVVARAKRSDPAAFFGSVAWSPGGRWIAATRARSLYGADIVLVDPALRARSRSLRVLGRFDSALAWSRDGASLYFAQQATDRRRPVLRRLVVATGKVLGVSGARGLDPSAPADGAVLFTGADGIRVIEHGRQRPIAGSVPRDRYATWLAKGLLLAERPARNCPRLATPQLCSRVVVLPQEPGAPRYVISGRARNPAVR